MNHPQIWLFDYQLYIVCDDDGHQTSGAKSKNNGDLTVMESSASVFDVARKSSRKANSNSALFNEQQSQQLISDPNGGGGGVNLGNANLSKSVVVINSETTFDGNVKL